MMASCKHARTASVRRVTWLERVIHKLVQWHVPKLGACRMKPFSGDLGQVLGKVCLLGQLRVLDVNIQIHDIVQAHE